MNLLPYTLIFILNLISPKYKCKKGIFIFYMSGYFFLIESYLIKELSADLFFVSTLISFIFAIGFPFIIFTYGRGLVEFFMLEEYQLNKRKKVMLMVTIFSLFTLSIMKLVQLAVDKAYFIAIIGIIAIILGSLVSYKLIQPRFQDCDLN